MEANGGNSTSRGMALILCASNMTMCPQHCPFYPPIQRLFSDSLWVQIPFLSNTLPSFPFLPSLPQAGLVERLSNTSIHMFHNNTWLSYPVNITALLQQMVSASSKVTSSWQVKSEKSWTRGASSRQVIARAGSLEGLVGVAVKGPSWRPRTIAGSIHREKPKSSMW